MAVEGTSFARRGRRVTAWLPNFAPRNRPCKARAAGTLIQAATRLDAIDDTGLVVIAQVLADTRRFVDDRYAEASQKRARPDAREL